MKFKESLTLIAICGVLVLLSAFGIIASFASTVFRGDLDRLLLAAICLLTGCVFSVQLFFIVREMQPVHARGKIAAARTRMSATVHTVLAKAHLHTVAHN